MPTPTDPKELKEQIEFLRRTLVGLEDCSHVRIMRRDLQKAEEQYMNLLKEKENG